MLKSTKKRVDIALANATSTKADSCPGRGQDSGRSRRCSCLCRRAIGGQDPR